MCVTVCVCSGGAVPAARGSAGRDHHREGQIQARLRGPAQTAPQRVHDRIQHDHKQAEGKLPDAHTGWRRRAGAGGQFGSVLRGNHVQVRAGK